MMKLVDYGIDGAVAVITLNRPPVNALSKELVDDIDEAAAMAGDPAIRAVVITGAPHFAAGADIKGFLTTIQEGSGEQTASGLTAVTRRIERLAKPVIAAVRGYALGGGLELAMSADFRYLADDAQVGQPEIKLGIIPGAGGTQRLGRIVGFQRAKELNFSGRHISADEALSIGLADEVFPAEHLLDAAMQEAAKFAAGPTLGYAAVKKAMSRGWGRPIDKALDVERVAFEGVFVTNDAREGIAAFVEKRTPDFRGT